MKIKKGDNILVIAGKDKGKTGKVLRAFPREDKVLVEGVNFIKKHVRPRRAGEKGQIITMPSPIHISNIKLICPNCGRPARVGYKLEQDKKFRICKKCHKNIS